MDQFNFNQPVDLEQEESSQFDFGKLLRGLWKRKWLIVLLTMISGAFFYVQIQNEVMIYEAKVLLRTLKLDEDAGQILSRQRQLEMATRDFKERVAARLGLALKIEKSSLGQNRDDIFTEFSTTKDPVAGQYIIETTQSGDYYLKQNVANHEVVIDSAVVWDAVEELRFVNGLSFRLSPKLVQSANTVHFRILPFRRALHEIGNVKVVISKTGRTMQLSKTGTDPFELAEELNRIAQVYVQETTGLKDRDEYTRMNALRRRLQAAEDAVRESEEELRRFSAKYPLSLEAEKRSLTDRLINIKKELQRIPKYREQLKNLLDRLTEKEETADPIQYRRYIVRQLATFEPMENEPNLAILRETLSDQEQRYDRLVDAYSKEYGPVQELENDIYQTQEDIIAFASKYLNTLAQEENEHRRQIEEIQTQLSTFPKDESRLNELKNRLAINQELYNRHLAEIQKYSVSDAVEEEKIEILEPAVPPSHPINPTKKQQVLLGGGLGFLLGMVISIVIDLMDRRLRTIQDVEKFLKLDVIGAIPLVDFVDIPDYSDYEKIRQVDRQLVTHDYSPTPIGESYRALRTHLLFSRKDTPIHSLVITSVGAEEGKSFTASNLAIILAQQRTNTLLVDADLRRGVLHNTFGLDKEPGLTDYLNNKKSLLGVIQQTHIPNLSLMSCGSMIPNPSESLGSLQMKRFLEEVRRKFDFIVLDTPPLEAATDAVVLGAQTDALTLVVRAGKTDKYKAQEKLDIFNAIPTNFIGVILNGADSTLIQNQYSYYHY
jgi:tyrosine-protein kinase Etk/Wzc